MINKLQMEALRQKQYDFPQIEKMQLNTSFYVYF